MSFVLEQIKKIPIRFEVGFQSLLTLLSPVLNTKYLYWRKTGRKINLKHPVTFSDKINWLKLFVYHNNPLVIRCSDKYTIRSYVNEVGCPEILNELYGVYDRPEDILWYKLPDTFVIKWNFGNGYNIFCYDKSNFDMNAAVSKLKKWGKRQPHLYLSVMHYKHIKRKIVIEKLIEGNNGKLPDDYKIYCFNGEPSFVMLCKNRETGKPRFYFTKICLQFNDHTQAPELMFDPPHDLPKGIEKAVDYARMLSKPFPFVRVDFYLSSGKPVLGEMTFVPSGGFDSNRTMEREILFGNMLVLSDLAPFRLI